MAFLSNTLLLDSEEYIDINKSIKMPTIYTELKPIERYKKLTNIISEKWIEEKPKIPKESYRDRIDGIKFEMNIIKETNEVVHTADYFLDNERIVDLAINKYNGVLTKSGRGSGSGFYINKLLKLTSIDRFALEVPIFPTRFISKSRLLESRQIADFDFNVKDPQPFIDATKEVFGNNQCYWMDGVSFWLVRWKQSFSSALLELND